jgi:hypothetical protein
MLVASLASSFESGELPLTRDQGGPVFASQPIHFTCEFLAEFLEQFVVQELLF